MRKVKTEIKIEPYPKGGWYVVERVGGKVWWQSSNYQSLELAEVRMKERKELKDNMAKLLDKKLAERLKPRSGLATKPTLVKRISKAKMRYLKRLMSTTKCAINSLNLSTKLNSNLLRFIVFLAYTQPQSSERFTIAKSSLEAKKLIRGHWVRAFKYEDLCSYFDILRGIPNGNDATTMGNG